MASQQTSVGLPADHDTLRFYLDGVHQFLRWSEQQIALGMGSPISSPGRLFLVFQQILEPYLAAALGQKEAGAGVATLYPSVSSLGDPFEVTPAFLAIQPFLDREEVLARLKMCRTVAEAIEPIPSALQGQGPRFGDEGSALRGRSIGKVRSRSDLTAEEQALRSEPPQQDRKRPRQKMDTAIAAFEGLLDPFRVLAQGIAMRMAGDLQESRGEASDDSDYVPMSWLLPFFDNSYHRLGDWLDNHREVGVKKPTPRRRLVHVKDFLRVFEEQHKKDQEALDHSPIAQKRFEKKMERRKRQIRKEHGLPDENVE